MSKIPQIIGLAGAAGAGKSEVANILANIYRYRRAPMAEPLKDMLITFGLSYDNLYGGSKETPLDMLGGKTPRHAMQTLGTEWGREFIGEDVWVNAWKAKYQREAHSIRTQPTQPVVVEDIRFQNEVDMVRDLGGIVFFVARPGVVADNTHISEQMAAKPEPYAQDQLIYNDGNLTDLRDSVVALCNRFKNRV